jgi:hypothetical protein
MKPTRYVCRTKVEYIEASIVRFIWPCGHSRKEEIRTGKPGMRKRLRVPIGADMTKKLVGYWNRCGGVHSPSCHRCGEPK